MRELTLMIYESIFNPPRIVHLGFYLELYILFFKTKRNDYLLQLTIIINRCILYLLSKQCFESEVYMRKVKGVTSKVLKVAKEEFLVKGYKDASLRTIAEKAGTATGSIYTRFGGKSGLFETLVYPTVIEVEKWFEYEQEQYSVNDCDKTWDEMVEYTNNRQLEFVDIIYKNFDVFKLLVQYSGGTEYQDFVHNLSTIHANYTIKYFENLENNSSIFEKVSYRLIHMLYNGYYSALFETVIYDMPYEEAKKCCMELQDFFLQGWIRLLEIK